MKLMKEHKPERRAARDRRQATLKKVLLKVPFPIICLNISSADVFDDKRIALQETRF